MAFTGWHHGIVKAAGTPLALGFSDREPVLVGKEAWDTIILNRTQIRHVTEVQAHATLDIGIAYPAASALEQYRQLRRRILATKNGSLVPFLTPRETPLPKGIPKFFPENHPEAWQVHVSDCSPIVSIGRWEADWSLEIVDGKIKGHIWLQKSWVDELIAQGNWDLILTTLQHEFFEGSITIPMTFLLYPTCKLEQLPGLVLQLQGWTHKLTIEAVDGYTDEAKYNRDDDTTANAYGMASSQ